MRDDTGFLDNPGAPEKEPGSERTDPGSEGRVRELTELARRAPGKITEKIAGMPLREQAELALRLPPAARLELLLHSTMPMRLVRMLPDAELYLSVREVGPADALPLIALASGPQLTHLLDLESWRRDEFDAKRCGGWVALLLESGEPTLRRFLKRADDELLVLLFQKWARVVQIEIDDTPDKHGAGETEAGTEAGFVSPDGYHRFSPVIPEHGPAVRRLAEILMREFPERYQQVVWSALWQPALEVEEEALRWRQSRLEEHGFPPWDEALNVYAPPDGVRTHPEPPAPESPEAPAAPRTPLRLPDLHNPLIPAVDRLDDDSRERVLHEAVSLANHLLVADSADTGDPEAHHTAIRKAVSYAGIALARRGAREASAAAEVLREVPVVELFREGYHLTAALQRRARELSRTGWASRHPSALELLDPPIRPCLSGLLQPRPLYFDPRAGGDEIAYREFRSLEEVEEAQVALLLAEVLGRLMVERLGLDLGAVLREEQARPLGPPRFSTLLLTVLAWSATRGELRCEPLPVDVTSQFLRTVASHRTAGPEAPARAMATLVRRLADEADLAPADVSALEAFGRACLDKLAEECSALDPGVPVEGRWISCLLIAGSR